MQKDTVLVSAADAEYFVPLKGLVLSIHNHRPDAQAAIGVLDLGMTAPQLDELRAMGCVTAKAEWDFDFPGRDQAPRWLQAMTSRCHLPRYFPEKQTYIWLDADVWLQDWRAIDLLERVMALRSGLAIVPELHRAYSSNYTRGNAADSNNKLLYTQYASAYGEPLARRIVNLPVMNSGVFAIDHDSIVWQKWSDWMSRGLKTGIHKLTEQNALNAAIYTEQIPFHPLPAFCNWICGQSLPKFDQVSKRFVEPLLPYEPISILHVTPRKKLSNSTIRTLDGASIAMELDYLSFR